VTNTLDSGAGSLRDALASVNAGAGGDVINFSGVTGTISLGSVLSIGKSVAINGPGANLLTISGNDAVEVFNAVAGTAVTISGLTIAHGFYPAGGGIQANGSALTVNNCTFSDNASNNTLAINVGGAIITGGSTILTVNSSTFVNNSATGTNAPSGGTIWASSISVVNNSTFFGNSASQGGAIAG
jgi:trimeric autotransporter adhesin